MSGTWAAVGVGVLVVLLVGREVLRWRGRRWFGGMRPGRRHDED